jgi:hypothetical protein
MNEAMKLERENFLNAGAYERSKNRPDYANGFEPRTLNMWSGRVTFAIPQTQNGGFHERGRGPLENVLYEPGEPGGAAWREAYRERRPCGSQGGKGSVFPAVPWRRCFFHLCQNAQAFARKATTALRGAVQYWSETKKHSRFAE